MNSSQATRSTPQKSSPDDLGDDELYENSAFQFAADRLGKLVRIAERDPKKQVVVNKETLERLYFAYLGALDMAKEHTQAALNISGEVHLCSRSLQQAVVPLVAENIRRKAEVEVLKDLADAKRKNAMVETKLQPPPLKI